MESISLIDPVWRGFECAFARRLLERHPYSQLRRKRNPHRRSWSKEISRRALGYLELLQAGDG